MLIDRQRVDMLPLCITLTHSPTEYAFGSASTSLNELKFKVSPDRLTYIHAIAIINCLRLGKEAPKDGRSCLVIQRKIDISGNSYFQTRSILLVEGVTGSVALV